MIEHMPLQTERSGASCVLGIRWINTWLCSYLVRTGSDWPLTRSQALLHVKAAVVPSNKLDNRMLDSLALLWRIVAYH